MFVCLVGGVVVVAGGVNKTFIEREAARRESEFEQELKNTALRMASFGKQNDNMHGRFKRVPCVIRNTFVHINETPKQNERRRSASTPGDYTATTPASQPAAHHQTYHAIRHSHDTQEPPRHDPSKSRRHGVQHLYNQHAHSHGSDAPSNSAVTSLERCFLQGTMIPSLDHGPVCVEHLKQHDLVRAADGQSMRIVDVFKHEGPHQIITLQQEDVFLRMTASHRVVVSREGRHEPAAARDLRAGDDIVTASRTNEYLVHLTTKPKETTEHLMAVELIFYPNLAIKTFPGIPSRALLTLGGCPRPFRQPQQPETRSTSRSKQDKEDNQGPNHHHEHRHQDDEPDRIQQEQERACWL